MDGHIIPPTAQIAVSRYYLQHNEANSPDHFQFKPERWLALDEDDSALSSGNNAASEQQQRTEMRCAFAPFSIVDRGRVGKVMVWLEMRLVTAKTMWYFDFECAPGSAGGIGGGWPGRMMVGAELMNFSCITALWWIITVRTWSSRHEVISERD